MTKLSLANTEDLERVLPLVAAFHAEVGIEQDDTARRAALVPILEGLPHGCIYLAGPRRAPIGYTVVSFGWSVQFGGLEATVDELFIRPGVRGRGIGTDILLALPKTLAGAGVKALHLDVGQGNDRARRFYEKLHFSPREGYVFLTRVL